MNKKRSSEFTAGIMLTATMALGALSLDTHNEHLRNESASAVYESNGENEIAVELLGKSSKDEKARNVFITGTVFYGLLTAIQGSELLDIKRKKNKSLPASTEEELPPYQMEHYEGLSLDIQDTIRD